MAFVPSTSLSLLPFRSMSTRTAFVSSPPGTVLSSRPRPRHRLGGRPAVRLTAGTAGGSSEGAAAGEAGVGTGEQDVRVKFPLLYDAWFEPGHELAGQVQDAVGRAYADGVREMELQWPVVPNLEEIAAGTLLNFEFGKQVSRDLGMDGTSEYPVIWAVSTDAVAKTAAADVLARYNVRLTTLRSPPARDDVGDDDVFVVMDPRFDEAWIKAARLKPNGPGACVIYLNSQFSENYGLTGPRRGALKGTKCVYFLKRVTRGYTFFAYPGPWQAVLEHPDSSVEVLREFDDVPKLRTIANTVREESNRQYGAFYNDRYVQGFGGRL